jgi:transposase
MPWKEVSVVNLRKEFVDLAKNSENITRLCKNFGISRKTGYKWLERFENSGQIGLENLSRRPVNSPGRISAAIEEAVIDVRKKHHAWGGRKIKRFLQNRN